MRRKTCEDGCWLCFRFAKDPEEKIDSVIQASAFKPRRLPVVANGTISSQTKDLGVWVSGGLDEDDLGSSEEKGRGY